MSLIAEMFWWALFLMHIFMFISRGLSLLSKEMWRWPVYSWVCRLSSRWVQHNDSNTTWLSAWHKSAKGLEFDFNAANHISGKLFILHSLSPSSTMIGINCLKRTEFYPNWDYIKIRVTSNTKSTSESPRNYLTWGIYPFLSFIFTYIYLHNGCKFNSFCISRKCYIMWARHKVVLR